MFARYIPRTAQLTKPVFACNRVAFNAMSKRLNSSNALNTEAKPVKYSAGPVNVKYTEEHEWIALHPDGTAFLGITKYAADALGDATYIELPTIGDAVEKDDAIGSVESVKSASEIFCPVAGEVTDINSEIVENPGLLNSDPMGEGWLVEIKTSEPESFGQNLLTLEQYEKSLEGEDH